MGGWVKLYREIRQHWIWENPNFLKWWLDIIMRANHKPAKVLINGHPIIINQGVFHTSETKLAQSWLVSRMTVHRFLVLLEKDDMISVTRSRQNGTTIKVSNYAVYQGFSDPAVSIEVDNEVSNEGASGEHKQECINNVKEKKKISTAEDMTLVNEFFDAIWKLLPSHKNDVKRSVKPTRRKQLQAIGYDIVSKACADYLDTQNPNYLHKRDNFFNNVIDNFLAVDGEQQLPVNNPDESHGRVWQ